MRIVGVGQLKRILFSRFALLSLGCIGALALVMSFVLSSLLTRAAFDWEWENTAALVRREVRMAGLQTVFAAPGGPQERERWGRQFSDMLTSLPEVVRVKVWDNHATILWSDESHLIGRQFSDNEELRDALQGKLEVEIKSLNKEENGYERQAFTTLAEVYVPFLRTRAGYWASSRSTRPRSGCWRPSVGGESPSGASPAPALSCSTS